MEKKYKLLIINPGSTTTKLALYENETAVLRQDIVHHVNELSCFPTLVDQLPFRKSKILQFLTDNFIELRTIDAIVGRGGLLKPLAGGTYLVNTIMLRDLRAEKRGSHASNLGGILAFELAESIGIPAYIADPVTVDELAPVARITGLAELERVSIFHALNQKACARRAALQLGKPYQEVNLIVAHLGGGISIGTHQKGRVIDVNNALGGEGPFSPERSGGLPVEGLVDLCFSGYTKEELLKKLIGTGGLVSHLGTNDAMEVETMIGQGNQAAALVYEAMAYQVAKAIGGSAAVLAGNVDAIVITGGIANSEFITDYIRNLVKFIAPVFVYPGEDEMNSLAICGLRVLKGEEQVANYENR